MKARDLFYRTQQNIYIADIVYGYNASAAYANNYRKFDNAQIFIVSSPFPLTYIQCAESLSVVMVVISRIGSGHETYFITLNVYEVR